MTDRHDRQVSGGFAARLRQDNERQTSDLRSRLPKNRELLNKIYQYGLQPV